MGKEAIDLISEGFYKVIVVKVDIFESEIVDERNFPTEEEAEKFRAEHEVNKRNMYYLVVKVE